MTADDRETVSIGAAAAATLITAIAAWRGTPSAALPTLYTQMHEAVSASILSSAPATAEQQVAPEVEKPTQAEIKKSVTPDAIISFIDGKPYKTLKRHLGTHGLDLRGYRERYGLPADYPSVAPNYAAQRSALAKSIGLGVPKRSEAA